MKKEKTIDAIYDGLKTALSIAWEDDDLMTQDNLFRLQEHLANLTLMVAEHCGNAALTDLCKSFPYLYSMK